MQLGMDLGGGGMYAKHVGTTNLENGLTILYNENLLRNIKSSSEEMNG